MRRGGGRRGAAVVAVGLGLALLGGAGGAGAADAGIAPAVAAADARAVAETGLVTAVAAQPSPGCRSAREPTTGTATETVAVSAAGRTGAYALQVPTTARPHHPLPLVVDFHGYAEPGPVQVTLSGLGAYGQTHGFITVTPYVDEPVPLWESEVGSADMSFAGAVLDSAERRLCVDEHRVYVTGYSNGAFMSSAMACQFAGRVAAVAPVAGIMALPHCHPARPVPVLAFHGTADPFVPYDGGPSKAAADLPAPDGSGKTLGEEAGGSAQAKGVIAGGPTVPQEEARWAARNGCAPTLHTTTVSPDVTELSYHCPDHADVELLRVTGGGHAWPGSEGSKEIASVVGFTTFTISADDAMWRFFVQHPLTAKD